MKLLKRYVHLYYIILPLLLATSLVFAFKFPHILNQFITLNWLPLILGIIIVCTPWGSIKLKSKDAGNEKLAWPFWLAKILGLELALFFLYYGITQFTNVMLPIETTAHPQAFIDSITQFTLHAGLFPWGIIAILATALGIQAFIFEKNSYISTALNFNFMSQREGFAVTVNAISRIFTIVILCLTGAMISLIFASLIAQPLALASVFGINSSAMGAVLVTMYLTSRKKSHTTLQAVYKQQPALGLVLLVLIWGFIVAVVSLILFYFVGPSASARNSINFIFSHGWQWSWQIFSTAWWIAFVPLTSIFVAKFSQGYSLRAMILATLILPLLLSVLLLTQQHHAWSLPSAPVWLIQTISIIGFILLMSLMANTKSLPLVMQTYLAKPELIKHRNENLFVRRFKRVCGIMFYFFIPAGIFVITYVMLLALVPFAIFLILLCFSIIMSLFKLQKS